MNERNFRLANISNDYMQARQHAQERADIIKASSFASLTGLTKRPIGGTGFTGDPFYEEVIETVSGIYKDYRINIYKGNNDKVLCTLLVHRANPRALVDGSTVNSTTVDSTEIAMTAHASQELVASKIDEGIDSTSNNSTMSAKVFKEYLDTVLQDYQLAESTVKRPSQSAVGNAFRPVYVDSDGYAKVTNSDYRFNENVSPTNISILVTDTSGNFYMDYQTKTTFFENEAR